MRKVENLLGGIFHGDGFMGIERHRFQKEEAGVGTCGTRDVLGPASYH